ncbi:MAG: vWA domain-containing protein [Byssovorax sp.]
MRTLLLLGTAISLGAIMAACGSGGAGTSQSTGSGGASTSSGQGGGQGGHTSGDGGGLFDAGPIGDSSVNDSDACGSVMLKTHTQPGNIVVVFDQSDSMKQPFQAGSGPKWQVAEDALVAALTPIQGIVSGGTIFFPTKATGNTCSGVDPIMNPPQIPIQGGPAFLTAFQGHFSAPGWALILGTPLKLGLEEADKALPDPSPLLGARAVVLITDGAPTCDTVAANILAPVQAMFSRGIKTYAIGLPGSAAAGTLLDKIAMAGGTMNYLTPADPMALQTALGQIASSTIDACTITLDPPPADKSKVHLIVTDAMNPKGYEIPEMQSGDGWSLSADGMTATLLGAVCEKAKAGGYSTIDFVYGCPPPPM